MFSRGGRLSTFTLPAMDEFPVVCCIEGDWIDWIPARAELNSMSESRLMSVVSFLIFVLTFLFGYLSHRAPPRRSGLGTDTSKKTRSFLSQLTKYQRPLDADLRFQQESKLKVFVILGLSNFSPHHCMMSCL